MSKILDSGASSTAEFLDEELSRWERRLQKSAAFGVEAVIRGELADVWEECSHPNWDGYNALAVTSDSYRNAEQFLRSLPLGVVMPSVGAEPDGMITLEWGHSRRRILSVSVSPDGNLHYAALLGAGRTCGTEPFFGEVPKIILNLIGSVC